MGVAVAEGEQPKGRDPGRSAAPGARTPLPALRLDGPLLLDSAGSDPVGIEAIVFADDGIGVIRSPGDQPRVLPWSAVSAHMVERWAGGVIPDRWVEPQQNGADGSQVPLVSQGPQGPQGPQAEVTERRARVLPHTDRGAVIAVRTPFGTYRFLVPGGDPNTLSNRITDFAVRHQGLGGVPPMTTVARPRRGNDRRQGSRSAQAPDPWSKVQPYLVLALIVFIATAVTLILLQSAGTIHLPYLGGSGPGTVPSLVRTR
ncbi:MAG: hypothetical protein ACRD1G_14535 [Acidimicrobiales bacterium]